MADTTHTVGGIPYRAHDNGDGSFSQGTKLNAAGAIASGQVALSTSAATLLAARTTRRRAIIKNLDTSITIYIGPATVTAGNGMELKPGESMDVYSSALIQGIAASGTPNAAYWEEYS